MSEYKVKILKPNNWRKYPVGRLDISVGMPNHEGKKLAATMDWARERFKHLIVSVADTLQRHNYLADGMDEGDARRMTWHAGSEWIERNAELLEGTTVIRWESRLNHPLFKQYLQRTCEYVETVPGFRKSIMGAAMEYAGRRGMEVAQDRVNYLIEEIAVFDMLFEIEPAADVYPGSILPFWEQEFYFDKAAFTRIDFLRKSAT